MGEPSACLVLPTSTTIRRALVEQLDDLLVQIVDRIPERIQVADVVRFSHAVPRRSAHNPTAGVRYLYTQTVQWSSQSQAAIPCVAEIIRTPYIIDNLTI